MKEQTHLTFWRKIIRFSVFFQETFGFIDWFFLQPGSRRVDRNASEHLEDTMYGPTEYLIWPTMQLVETDTGGPQFFDIFVILTFCM